MEMSVSEAKAKLSELVDRARLGEEVLLTNRGRVVARVVGVGREEATITHKLAGQKEQETKVSKPVPAPRIVRHEEAPLVGGKHSEAEVGWVEEAAPMLSEAKQKEANEQEELCDEWAALKDELEGNQDERDQKRIGKRLGEIKSELWNRFRKRVD